MRMERMHAEEQEIGHMLERQMRQALRSMEGPGWKHE